MVRNPLTTRASDNCSELAMGPGANVACRGVAATAGTQTIGSERSGATDMAPIAPARFARPDEVHASAGFSLSEAASCVTGQVISVDGGFTIAV